MPSMKSEKQKEVEGGQSERGGGRLDGGGGWILNQRSPLVTPSGVPPSGHVPKIATGAVSSAKPPASGLQPACECEISMGIVGHLPASALFPPPPPPFRFFPFSDVTGR